MGCKVLAAPYPVIVRLVRNRALGRTIQYCRDDSDLAERPLRTGSPAFAEDGELLSEMQMPHHTAPAFCAYSHEAFDSGTVRAADSMALALAAVPSRMRPAIPWVMPARRNRL